MYLKGFRFYALKRAFAVIFENYAMLERSKELYSLKNTFYSKPSINQQINDEFLDFPEISADTKVGLFLCGWQKNKNYMLIPEILKEFRNKGLKFHIVITASKSEKKSYDEFMYKVKNYGVEEMVTIFGPVKKTKLGALYRKIDYVFLDGGHEYKTVKNDLECCKEVILNNGVVLCDDYDLSYAPGVKIAIDEFIENNSFKSSIISDGRFAKIEKN